jgi:tol-pal system protein YbgF
MPSGARWIACLLSFLLAGCAANDLMVKRQAETDAKVEHLIQSDRKDEQRLNEAAAQIQRLEEQARGNAALVKQLQTDLQELRVAHEELKARVTFLAQQPSSPKIAVVNQEPVPKGKDSGPPAEYLRAFGLYSTNSFPAAIEAFEEFLKSKPQSDYAANAVYWIGECHYSLSDFAKALSIFQKVVDTYPRSAKAPDAMLKMGYSLSAMKDKDKANATFESLIRTYPSSPAAVKARERLTAN